MSDSILPNASISPVVSDVADETHIFVGVNALLIVLIISIALGLAHLMKKFHFTFLSDSGASMLLGVMIGGLIQLFGWNESHHHFMLFEPELFFFILLPPIIFEAGYSMKKAAFFYNFGTILLFAVLGTLISTLIVGYGLFGLAKIGIIGLDSDNPIECLIFGSLISAVDPVAILSILQSSRLKSPLIYSLIFGESVLNDAVSIVLFNTFKNFHKSNLAAENRLHHHRSIPITSSSSLAAVGEFDHFTIGALFLDFLLVSVGSLWIGVLVGLICSFLFRHSHLSSTPDVEFVLVIFFAYASYCLSEILGLSGIMSLFFCSIILAHYNWYNLSLVSRSTTKHSFKSFALISETFLFSYLGLSAVVSVKSVLHLEWSVMLILFTMLLCLVARAVHIFPLSFLSNFSRSSSRQLSFAQQVFLWFSSIRGAIAFALSLNVFTNHRSIIISTTMMMVILTTVGFGGMASPMLRRLKLVENDPTAEPISPDDSSSTLRPRPRMRGDSVEIELITVVEPNSPSGNNDGEHKSDAHSSEHSSHSQNHRLLQQPKPSHLQLTLPSTELHADSPAHHPHSPIDPILHEVQLSSASEDATQSSPPLDCFSRVWKDFDEKYLQRFFGGYSWDRFEEEQKQLQMRATINRSLYHRRPPTTSSSSSSSHASSHRAAVLKRLELSSSDHVHAHDHEFERITDAASSDGLTRDTQLEDESSQATTTANR